MKIPQITTVDLKSLPIEKIYTLVNSQIQGLTTTEAIKRSKDNGYNEIAGTKKQHTLIKFLNYFKNPLIIILMIAALISGLTGELRSMVIILSMIFLSVSLNFYQEHKSSQAVEKILHRLSIKAEILRDSQKQELATKYIVPGDIIYLAAGDIVPADGKIISATDFFLNEASLTGESLPVEKYADKNNAIFSGTNVVSGFGQFLVTNIGLNTEFGRIVQRIARPEIENAFEKGINNFGFLIIRVIVFIVASIFLINAILHKGLLDSLLFSLAVAVGVTPELLPMIMSVNMAKSATRMAKGGVLIKKLNAIPTFGSMDILCTDKTGTLTEDRITVIKHVDIFGQESPNVFKDAYINGYFETGIKSILDQAILDYQKIELSGYTKIKELPYDFNRKRSSIIYKKEGILTMITKGAPEEIFKICTHYFFNDKRILITPEILKQAQTLYDNFSNEGLRILAITEKTLDDEKEQYSLNEENNLTLRGFMAFYDPPKADVEKTLIFMKKHGVEIKILTGDSPLVTKKICADLGLNVTGIITGEDLDLNRLTDEEVYKKVKNATICARLSPSQKEKIIMELKRNGSIVGYLGDGINDAPSLKTADVGISVDNGVDVAKETADIILMKKGLKELMAGILEGRKSFGNTMKYLLMSLSSNFGNMFSMIGASLFLPFFPMTAGQILLNNFIYDSAQLSIPTDNVDLEYLKKPKHWNMSFIKKYMIVFGPISSIFDFLTFYVLYGVFHFNVATFQAGWFVESLATQILVIYIIRTQKTPFLQSSPSKSLIISTLGAILIGIILTFKGIGGFFGFSPLPMAAFVAIFLIVIVYLIVMEIVKQLFYKQMAIKN
ncbi:MAG: magnesium-translocating P-type ATPase [Patescibacteria group bacterium]|jgi:Mg2+-importing ATPase